MVVQDPIIGFCPVMRVPLRDLEAFYRAHPSRMIPLDDFMAIVTSPVDSAPDSIHAAARRPNRGRGKCPQYGGGSVTFRNVE